MEKWRMLLDENQINIHFENQEEFEQAVIFALDHILQKAGFAVPLEGATADAWQTIVGRLRDWAGDIEKSINQL